MTWQILLTLYLIIGTVGYLLQRKLAKNLTTASVVSIFASFMTVLVVLSAYFFLKEKDRLWFKIGAAIVGTIGLIILNSA
ncbi:hypothetical protein CYG49_01665 [Candidatus Saccharibacteria bacterium]|nr:MAG: hypothetical protein CYG49_01665 [Candidatus Saccharibacteria bacterium]